MHVHTVEPLYSGHLWDPAGCPVCRGVPNSEVDLYTALYVFGTADSVLNSEVSYILNVLYREVPLYLAGTVIQLSTAGLTTDCTDNCTHSCMFQQHLPCTPSLWLAAPSHNPMDVQ